MTSRRDELNAYTFARKRTVAAFLKPLPNGSADDAPRPMKALLPGIVVGALILVGFGGYGMIKPSAPTGWNSPGEKVLVGSKSTTRYVYLDSGKKDKNGKEIDLLHPVLNLASARLLLDPSKYEVLKVDESVLDDPKIQHGPTIGIPYAPDRLPEKDEAAKAKVWALCERPGAGSDNKAQKAVFVLGGNDKKDVENSNKLKANQALFVQAPGGGWYLVDNKGTAYPIGKSSTYDMTAAEKDTLRRALFGNSSQPQTVTQEFMDTLNVGAPILFPAIDGAGGTSTASGLPAGHKTIGTVLVADDAAGRQQYVVLKDRLAPISDFTARLLLQGPNAHLAYGNVKAAAIGVNTGDLAPGAAFQDSMWPKEDPTQVNNADGRKVSCNVFSGAGDSSGHPVLSTWAGTDYPEQVSDGGTSAYVTPGSGILLRRVSSLNTNIGSVFLVTDTGLRYSVPSNGDSGTAAANTTSASGSTSTSADPAQDNAPQKRLGYDGVTAVPVPNAWADLLAAGPTLDTASAKQPQNQ
jgi:type VII secretion protein EccB